MAKEKDDYSHFELISKGVSYLKRAGKIKECFYHLKEECSGDIIEAHCIQQNGRLSLLEGDISGNASFYSFGRYISSPYQMIYELKPIGKKTATTFTGFCSHHDKLLFSAIDDNKFDNSKEHLFLHTYRTFAYWYHSNREVFNAMNNDNRYGMGSDVNSYKNQSLELIKANNFKKKIDKIIEKKRYDMMRYFFHKTQRTHLIASTGNIRPPYYLNNKPFNDPFSNLTSDIFLTVLPNKGSTIIILACFSDDLRAIKFLEDLFKLYPIKLEKAISSLLIYNTENTFFSPFIWKKFTDYEKGVLISDLNNAAVERYSNEILFDKFFHSEVNLFSHKFSAEYLKIDI